MVAVSIPSASSTFGTARPIGTWLGLIPPTFVSFALSDGWWQPLTVIAIYGGLELICNNVFEPWLYGASMGLSEVAQLVSAGLWAFLWGPIGLILSGPLTVVLLVLGKYVRKLEFLAVLMGDEPALEPRVAFYQRLAARDQDEASAIALREAEKSDPEAVLDTVVVPAIGLAREVNRSTTAWLLVPNGVDQTSAATPAACGVAGEVPVTVE